MYGETVERRRKGSTYTAAEAKEKVMARNAGMVGGGLGGSMCVACTTGVGSCQHKDKSTCNDRRKAGAGHAVWQQKAKAMLPHCKMDTQKAEET